MVSSTSQHFLCKADSHFPRFRLYLDNFLRHAGPFSDEDFETSEEAASNIGRMNILSVWQPEARQIYANILLQGHVGCLNTLGTGWQLIIV